MATCIKHSLLLLALAAVSLPHIAAAARRRETTVHFDVVSGEFEELYHSLMAALSDHRPRLDVRGHLVLAPERPIKKFPPQHPIHLKLSGEHGDEATVFIAEDDVSILGFANSSGDWYMLPGFPFFPHAQELPFGSEYDSLIEGGVDSLHTIPLGRESMLHAAHAMSGYDPLRGDPMITRDQIQLAFCRLGMMVSESLRFRPIRDSFAPGFDQESFADQEDCELVRYWGMISELLLRWKRCSCWESEHMDEVADGAGVTGPDTALGKIGVIARRKGF